MAVNFRSVSQLEAVTSLADDDKILVVQGGTAKAIKKSDAKFGGGGTTTVYNVVSSESAQATDSTSYTLQNADGSEVTAQEVYNAFVAGRVLLSQSNDENSLVATQGTGSSPVSVARTGGTSVNVLGKLAEVSYLILYGDSVSSIVGVKVFSDLSTITVGSTGNR